MINKNIEDFVNKVIIPGINPSSFIIKLDNNWCSNFNMVSEVFTSEEDRQAYIDSNRQTRP